MDKAEIKVVKQALLDIHADVRDKTLKDALNDASADRCLMIDIVNKLPIDQNIKTRLNQLSTAAALNEQHVARLSFE